MTNVSFNNLKREIAIMWFIYVESLSSATAEINVFIPNIYKA